MKSPIFRRLRLAAALFLLGFSASLALAQNDLAGPQAEVDAAAATPALRRTLKALASQTQVCRVISSYACYGMLDGKTKRT